MVGKAKLTFWFDLTIFTAFLSTALTGLLLWLILPSGRGSGQLIYLGLTRRTWVEVHNWFGLAMLLGALLHLALHWPWIKCIVQRFFGKLARQARLYFWLDSLMSVAFILTGLSGLVVWLILPGGGYQGGRNPFYNATLLGLTRHNWIDLHLWTGLALILILTIHLALHWRWVVCMTRRYTQPTICRVDECITV